MAAVSNILAQLAPGAGVDTVLFTVPKVGYALIDELAVCNRDVNPAAFRFSISLTGGATATKDYIYFNLPIVGNDTFVNEIGVTLPAGAIVRVYASSANLTFTLFGSTT